jgi:hypothetical protein
MPVKTQQSWRLLHYISVIRSARFTPLVVRKFQRRFPKRDPGKFETLVNSKSLFILSKPFACLVQPYTHHKAPPEYTTFVWISFCHFPFIIDRERGTFRRSDGLNAGAFVSTHRTRVACSVAQTLHLHRACGMGSRRHRCAAFLHAQFSRPKRERQIPSFNYSFLPVCHVVHPRACGCLQLN